MKWLFAILFFLPSGKAFSAQGLTSELKGQVYSTDEKPLSGVTVELLDAMGRTETIQTDSAGSFVFSSLPGGRYRLAATRNGYVKQQLGGSGPSLLLDPGSSRSLIIHMERAGIVLGTVTGKGQPMSDAEVLLIQRHYDVRGREIVIADYAVQTDDRGEYRIKDVKPGSYFVSVGPPRRNSPRPRTNMAQYQVTYYPGTEQADRAQQIVISPDSETRTNFALTPTTKFVVRGRAVDAKSLKPIEEGADVSLVPRDELVGPTSGPTIATGAGPLGRFELRDVTPGRYWLQVRVRRLVGIRGQGQQTLSQAIEAIEVRGADISDFEIRVGASITALAHVKVDEGSLSAETRTSVHMQLQPPFVGSVALLAPPSPTQIGADGSMQFTGLCEGGSYSVVAASLPAGYYLKDVLVGSKSILGTTFSAAQDMPAIEIILSARGARIAGVVREVTKGVGPIPAVILIPDQSRSRLDLYRLVSTDGAGKFELTNVSPGEYFVVALNNLNPNEQFNPELLNRFRRTAARIVLSESSKADLDLAVSDAASVSPPQ